jgi:hypothetical protein
VINNQNKGIFMSIKWLIASTWIGILTICAGMLFDCRLAIIAGASIAIYNFTDLTVKIFEE